VISGLDLVIYRLDLVIYRLDLVIYRLDLVIPRLDLVIYRLDFAAQEWSCHVEETKDGGLTWQRHGPIELDGKIVQPALFLDQHANVHMVIRTRKHYMAVRAQPKEHHKTSQNITKHYEIMFWRVDGLVLPS
jgi:hypothetical protein